MTIESPAFEAGGMIPQKYTCDGMDVSPPLVLTSVPDGTKSLALICDDPDAPMGTWVHWVMFNTSQEEQDWICQTFPDARCWLGGTYEHHGSFPGRRPRSIISLYLRSAVDAQILPLVASSSHRLHPWGVRAYAQPLVSAFPQLPV